MDRSTKKPTLADVAKLAGISISTASRALSGSKVVADRTAERVRQAAAKIGYTVNLRQERTSTLGVVVANIASPFYATLIEAVEDSASRQGYNIILCNSDYRLKRQQECLELLQEKHVDGLLISPIQTEDPVLQQLAESGMPIVQVDRYVENLRCDIVAPDNKKSSYQAVNFLIQQGYEKIAIVSGPLSHSTGRDRLAGYRQALIDNGREPDERLIKIGNFKKASGYQLTLELLDSPERPDALFTANLEMTTGALLALRDYGMVVPRDIGIVGFDEFEYASLLEPPLTTIEQPVYEMGSAAADLLIRRIQNAGIPFEPVTLRFEARLIVRASTRPQTRVPSEESLAAHEANS